MFNWPACLLSYWLVEYLVFRRTYNAEEGIEKGLLKQNLAFLKILKQIIQLFWCLFITIDIVYCSRHKNPIYEVKWKFSWKNKNWKLTYWCIPLTSLETWTTISNAKIYRDEKYYQLNKMFLWYILTKSFFHNSSIIDKKYTFYCFYFITEP